MRVDPRGAFCICRQLRNFSDLCDYFFFKNSSLFAGPPKYALPSCDGTGPLSKKMDMRRRSFAWPRPALAVGPRLSRAHVPKRNRFARVIPT
jgi:hypothetical protein